MDEFIEETKTEVSGQIVVIIVRMALWLAAKMGDSLDNKVTYESFELNQENLHSYHKLLQLALPEDAREESCSYGDLSL